MAQTKSPAGAAFPGITQGEDGLPATTSLPARRARVAFVDDDADLLAGLRRALRRSGLDWDMSFHGDPRAALAALLADPADVVVADIRMPGLNGIDLAAAMLSLMIRKELAQVTGVSQQELDSEFEIRSQATSAPAPARRPVQTTPSILRTVLELVVAEPRFAALIGHDDLELGRGAPGLDQADLQALEAVVDAVNVGDAKINLGEAFRDTPHENAVRNAEVGALRWQERSLEASELEAEFSGAWRQALDRIRRSRITALLEKSRQQGLSAEDQAQYRLLQQALSVTPSK